MCAMGWLPELLLFEDYNGDWNNYLEAIYEVFKRDFIDSKPDFFGREMRLKRHPVSNGKEATFWHFISEGKNEDERTPDMRRCERIRWPKPFIESADDGAKVKWWSNKRGAETRILLTAEDFSYVVILADRGNYILPWTAYYLDKPHRRIKLRKEYEEFRKRNNKS